MFSGLIKNIYGQVNQLGKRQVGLECTQLNVAKHERTDSAGKAISPSHAIPRSALRLVSVLSGNMLYPAPPRTIGASVSSRHTDTTFFTLSSKNQGISKF
jgi:hypothetical protein